MNVDRVMEEVMFKLSNVDDSAVVTDKCQEMVDTLKDEINSRISR